MILKYTTTPQDVGKRLNIILKDKLYISTRLLIKLKNGNCIFVNNIITTTNYFIKQNDIITVDLNNIASNNIFKYPLYDYTLDILYEDDYLLIVNKPAFMPVHPCLNNLDNTLLNAVYNYYIKKGYKNVNAHIITRLDSNTSGICIIAKNSYIHELFNQKNKLINIKKEYIALVNNIVKKDHDYIINNIVRNENSIITRKISTVPSIGKYAKTEYFVLERNIEKNYTKVRIILHTGRTHQIRVHFASIGHVLLGDSLYAELYDINYLPVCKKYINRHALFCSNVSFNHPITDNYINIICKLSK